MTSSIKSFPFLPVIIFHYSSVYTVECTAGNIEQQLCASYKSSFS